MTAVMIPALAHNRVLDALELSGRRVQRRGPTQATAQCPAHEDRNPSLSLTAIEGQVLLHCHAGCQTDDVLAALNLTRRDLFDDPRGEQYRYADRSGEVVRTVTRTPDKRFRQSGHASGTSTLYRLPQVLDAVAAGRTVYLVEGEKDVHALESLGAVATTAPMGASSWDKVDPSPLYGADVIAIPDRDQAGEKWARAVRESLIDRARSLAFRAAATGKDAADHIAAGRNLDELIPLQLGDIDDERDAELERQLAFNRSVSDAVHHLRVRQAAQEQFAAEQAANDPAPPFDCGSLAEILARPAAPRMRIEGLIPSEASTLAVAMRKTGKTTLELNYARSLILGGEFLGRFPVRAISGNVGFLNYEVSGMTIAQWANEHGVPDDRMFFVNLRGRRNPLGHPGDRETLARWLRERSIESLIVDPFGKAFIGKSQNDPGDVGAWLADLDAFARTEVGAIDVMLTAHAGWNGERTRGSSALEDWADSIIWMTRDPKDDTQRFLRAEGRDVLVDEDQLAFNAETRTLTLTGNGSRKQAANNEKLPELAVFVKRAASQVPGASTTDLVKIIRKMPDAPTFQDRDVSHAARWAQDHGFLQIIDNGRGKPKHHYPATPSNPVQSPSTDAPPTPRPPRLYGDGVGVDGVNETDPVQPDGVSHPCEHCNQPLHWQRHAYGKTVCADCEAKAREAS